MGGLGRKGWRIGPWQRRLLIGLAVALTSQLYLTVWAEGFRVSTAAILYPALLVTMMRESHRPDTGLVTGWHWTWRQGCRRGRRCGWSIPAACSTSAMTACSAC